MIAFVAIPLINNLEIAKVHEINRLQTFTERHGLTVKLGVRGELRSTWSKTIIHTEVVKMFSVGTHVEMDITP